MGHFGKYHNTFCLSPQILHKHCFQFLLRLTTVPNENENNAYAKFGGKKKEYYGIFRSDLLFIIGHYQITFDFFFKASNVTYLFIWKLVGICMWMKTNKSPKVNRKHWSQEKDWIDQLDPVFLFPFFFFEISVRK